MSLQKACNVHVDSMTFYGHKNISNNGDDIHFCNDADRVVVDDLLKINAGTQDDRLHTRLTRNVIDTWMIISAHSNISSEFLGKVTPVVRSFIMNKYPSICSYVSTGLMTQQVKTEIRNLDIYLSNAIDKKDDKVEFICNMYPIFDTCRK